MLIILLALAVAVPAYAEIRNEKFTKEEIKEMADTKAVIETKFGKIEIKFFPEVAPNHVDNFIDLAGKGFYDSYHVSPRYTRFHDPGR